MLPYLANYPFRRSTPVCFRSNFFARFFQLTHSNKKPTSANFLQIRRSNPWTRHCTTQIEVEKECESGSNERKVHIGAATQEAVEKAKEKIMEVVAKAKV